MTTDPYLKDPASRESYSINWNDYLVGAETISASTWAFPDDLTQYSTPTNAAGITSIWLTGGEHGEEYTVTNQITTSTGRIDERSLKILCRER